MTLPAGYERLTATESAALAAAVPAAGARSTSSGEGQALPSRHTTARKGTLLGFTFTVKEVEATCLGFSGVALALRWRFP